VQDSVSFIDLIRLLIVYTSHKRITLPCNGTRTAKASRPAQLITSSSVDKVDS
jgi:hypothetical protein